MALCPECGFEEPKSQWESLPYLDGVSKLCGRCVAIRREYNRLDSITSLEKRIAEGTYQSRVVLDALIAEGSRLDTYEKRKIERQKRRTSKRSKNQS